MEIHHAQAEDLPFIMQIYESARAFMRTNGNYSQWINGYPSEELLRADIEKQQLFVMRHEGRICGVFAFIIGEDPTYRVIENGAWRSSDPYGTIHRIAGDGTVHGILKQAVAFCEKRIGYLRIDTHEANAPMLRAVARNGFTRCGIIHLEDGSPRIAFDRI